MDISKHKKWLFMVFIGYALILVMTILIVEGLFFEHKVEHVDVMLFNNKGEIIVDKTLHSDKNWGNSLADTSNILSYYPNEYKNILSSKLLEKDDYVSRKLELPIDGGLYPLIKLNSLYLNKQQENTFYQYIIVSSVVILLSMILAAIIIKLFGQSLFNYQEIQRINSLLDDSSKVAKIGFWEFNNKKKIIHFSGGFYDFFEFDATNSEIALNQFLSFLGTRERKKFQKIFFSSISEKTELFTTHKLVTLKADVRYCEIRGRHYFDEDDNYIKTIGSVYDITDKYQEEQKFLSLLENAADGVHILDKEGHLILFSHSFAKNLGYSIEECKNLSVFDWDTAIPKEELKPAIKSVLKSPKTFETKHKRKDGSVIDVEINAKAVTMDGKKYVYASQRDITLQNQYKAQLEKIKADLEASNKELKKNVQNLETAKALYANERYKYKSILELASDGVFLLDKKGNLIEYSNKMLDLLGYSKSELKKLSVYDWDKSITKKEYNDLVHMLSTKAIELERVHTRKDGSTYIAHIFANLIKVDNQPFIYGSVRDITKQKEYENEISNHSKQIINLCYSISLLDR